MGADARRGRTFANCTHIIVSLLKAGKVTVVGIECDDATFQEGLEGDHGRYRVQWCRLLKSFQEGSH